MSSGQELEIQVKMNKKLIEQNSKAIYEFTVKLRSKNMEYKVQKTYTDFIEMEKKIREEFNPSLYPHLLKKVPKLDKSIISSTF